MRLTTPVRHLFGRPTFAAPLALAALCAVAAGGFAWVGPSGKVRPATASRPPALGQTRGLEVELVAVSPSGFEPARIARGRGPFLLSVLNRSGAPALDLTLRRAAGGVVREVKIREGGLKWRGALDLAPGLYVLGEAGHPEWECHITVSPD